MDGTEASGGPAHGRDVEPPVPASGGMEPEIQTRKVQVTGKSTYLVSLPKSWATMVKARSSDSVALFELPDGSLVVDPRLGRRAPDSSRRVVAFEPEMRDRTVRRVIGAYLAGHNIIEVRARQPLGRADRDFIRGLTRLVIGPEVVDETPSSMTLKDLLGSAELSMDQGLRRMHLLARDMLGDAIGAMRQGALLQAGHMEARDREVDRFHWLLLRQYNLIMKDVFFAERMGISLPDALSCLLVGRSIERIADHSVRLASVAPALHGAGARSAEIAAIGDRTVELFGSVVEAFNRNLFDRSNKAVDDARALRRSIPGLYGRAMESGGPGAGVAMSAAVNSLERVAAYSEDIAECSLNRIIAVRRAAGRPEG
jgi:phosphate uptake regulator